VTASLQLLQTQPSFNNHISYRLSSQICPFPKHSHAFVCSLQGQWITGENLCCKFSWPVKNTIFRRQHTRW